MRRVLQPQSKRTHISRPGTPRPFTRRDLWEVVEVNGVPQPAAYREPLAGPNCSYEVFSLEINFPMPQHADYRGDYGAGRRFIATYEGTRSRPSGARRHWKIGVGRRFLIVVGATVSLAPRCMPAPPAEIHPHTHATTINFASFA